MDSGFADFLRREIYCTASGCDWQYAKDEKGRDFVACNACGSTYPWRDAYYLARIYRAGKEK